MKLVEVETNSLGMRFEHRSELLLARRAVDMFYGREHPVRHSLDKLESVSGDYDAAEFGEIVGDDFKIVMEAIRSRAHILNLRAGPGEDWEFSQARTMIRGLRDTCSPDLITAAQEIIAA
jgi:hypothetical protein